MIQRVQSIFLLLVAITLVAMLFFPLWEKTDVENNEKIILSAIEIVHYTNNPQTNDLQVVSSNNTYPIAGLAILAALVALFSIFKYENRLTQIKLGALNSLLIGGSLGFSVYFIFEAEKVLSTPIQGSYLPGFYFTAAALFFNALANRFIRRDEKLVRSADRIR